jgi:uncharacterized protein YbjT (DUF2867 family)
MRVFVAGANGFIGRYIVAALNGSGHEVVWGLRRQENAHPLSIACDFSRDLGADIWAARLTGIEAVINAVGILRESKRNSFERIHVLGPKALFDGCALAGVRRVIQISAFGSPDVGEYLASKHRGDAELQKLDLDWTILRPSLVFSVAGSYGGTSLLRAMAALPGFICVPGSGEQPIQPIRAEDLALAVVRLIENRAGMHEVLSAVGPERVTLLRYLQGLRRWLELPPAVVIRVPVPLANGAAWLGELFSDGPLGVTMWRMLQQGNAAAAESAHEFSLGSGVTPLSMQQSLAAAPSFVQDRWHARLYFLGPALRVTLGLVWIASALVGFLMPISQSRALFASVGVSTQLAGPLVRSASAADLVLGALALVAWRPGLIASLMCVSLVIYTVFIGALFPWVWLEPFGGLLKNLPLIPAVLVMGILSRRR